MSSTNARASFWIFFLSTVFFNLWSPPLSGANFDDSVAAASTIVVGSVQGGFLEQEKIEIVIHVERVLFGAPPETALRIVHPWTRRGIFIGPQRAKLADGARGIWLLKQGAKPGEWDVIPANGPDGLFPSLFFPAAERVPPSLVGQGSEALSTKIVNEIAAGVEASGSINALLRIPRDNRGEGVVRALQYLRRSSSAAAQAAGLAAMLSRSMPEALGDFEMAWPTIRATPGAEVALDALKDFFRPSDDASLIALVGLARRAKSDPELRAATVKAIAAIHTRESLPFLAELLDSDDREEQMKGVFGLSSFANGCEPETPENRVSKSYLHFGNQSRYITDETIAHFAFRRGPDEQEAKVIAFWKTWWLKNESQVQAAP